MSFYQNINTKLLPLLYFRKPNLVFMLMSSALIGLCLYNVSKILVFKSLQRKVRPTGQSENNNNVANHPRPVRILLWTTLYSRFQHWEEWWFKQSYIQEGCPQVNCIFTTDRSSIYVSDAVLFHGFREDLNISDIPSFRTSQQRWIFVLNESPDFPFRNLTAFHGFFNWTMTFRNDSDIFGGYGDIVTTPNVNFNPDVVTNFAAGKTKLIGWMASHCNTIGRREDYVAELQKYVPVEIIGDCGTVQCPGRENDSCYRNIGSTYKFYLSFENNICPDYITEKLFAYIPYNIVPIVFGGPGYDTFIPKEAYIDALNFSSPKELARYLQELDKNDDLYNRFFDWKHGLIVTNPYKRRLNCELCKKVGDPTLPPKWYDDINFWWNKKRKCRYWKDGKTYFHE